MAKYNPFAEKAGMQKIAEQLPPKEALKIAEILGRLGFNLQLLGSEKYVLNKLQTLTDNDGAAIREAFIKHSHARFMKYFFCHMPFGKKQANTEEAFKASLERLARLIRVCGFLLQTKVYLSGNISFIQQELPFPLTKKKKGKLIKAVAHLWTIMLPSKISCCTPLS
jgi:hypothetical protein